MNTNFKTTIQGQWENYRDTVFTEKPAETSCHKADFIAGAMAALRLVSRDHTALNIAELMSEIRMLKEPIAAQMPGNN